MLITVKCPFCAYESEQDNQIEMVVCENCKKTFETQKGSKYYKSLKKIEEDDVIVAKGEDYLKVDLLLDKGDFYLKNEDFENAYSVYKEALTLTNVNYKIYLGLVCALTENFQKLNEQTHEFYLKKAFEVASDEEKEKIREIYLPYYNKNRKPKSENLVEEGLDNQKNKTKTLLKNCLDKHFSLEKALKFLKFFLPIASVLVIASFVLSFLVLKILFTIITVVLSLLILIAFSNYQSIKLKTGIINAVVDLYDNYDKLEIPSKDLSKIFKCVDGLAICYLNSESDNSLINSFTKLYKEISKSRSQKLFDFISKYKIYRKCCE